MPSLDGVGRYYPLALHAIADADAPILPPDIDTQDEWFGMAEDFLLSTLAREIIFDDICSQLDGLPVPRTRSRAAVDNSMVPLGDGMAGTAADGTDFATALSALRVAGPRRLCCRKLLVDGRRRQIFRPLALSCRGLPDPYRYSTLLTGDLGEIVHAR